MKLLLGLLLLSNILLSQPPNITIIGGVDTTICGDILLNLTCELDTNISGTESYLVQSVPYSPYPYSTGNILPIPIDDRWSGIQVLPFNFCFYGQQFNQYVISTNGVLSFNTSYANLNSPWAFSATIPTNAALFPRSMIGLFHDIDPSIGGEVRFGIIGTLPYRKLVVSFLNIPHYQCNGFESTFQIVLHEFTNIIEIFVERKQRCTPWNGGRACLGIQNNAGTLANAPPGRNTSSYIINVPEAWRFTPSSPPNQPQWFLNGGFMYNGFNFNELITSPSVIVTEYEYNCPSFIVTDTLFVDELPCCDPIEVDVFTD